MNSLLSIATKVNERRIRRRNAERARESRLAGPLVSADRPVALPHGEASGERKIPALRFLVEAPAHLVVAAPQSRARGRVGRLDLDGVGSDVRDHSVVDDAGHQSVHAAQLDGVAAHLSRSDRPALSADGPSLAPPPRGRRLLGRPGLSAVHDAEADRRGRLGRSRYGIVQKTAETMRISRRHRLAPHRPASVRFPGP